ncbi:hypothetical protein P3T40_005764 [Paraburkholderia sp. EB58]|jgi:hypothetical protein
MEFALALPEEWRFAAVFRVVGVFPLAIFCIHILLDSTVDRR